MTELSVLSIKQVCEKTALCRTTIYSRVNAGTFPRPVKIGFRLDEAEEIEPPQPETVCGK